MPNFNRIFVIINAILAQNDSFIFFSFQYKSTESVELFLKLLSKAGA